MMRKKLSNIEFRGAGFALTSCALAGLLVLSACSSVGGGRTYVRSNSANVQPVATQPFSAIEGNWLHSEGVFKATFKEGRFESISPQTGDRLAAGSYSTVGENQISLNWVTSRDTRESAGCQVVGDVRLSCAPTNGAPFAMTRA